jgi:MFS family permease
MFGALMFLPLYVQGALGYSAAASGGVLTPMMLSFIGGSILGGQIMTRTGRYKLQAHIAALVMVAGMFLLTTMSSHTTLSVVILNIVVLGLGIGALMPVLNVAVQNAFPYKIMGMVNSSQQFVQSLGGVVSAPILGTIMTETFARDLPERLPAALKASLGHLSPAARSALSDPQALTTQAAQLAIKSDFTHFGAAGLTLYHEFLSAVHVSLALGIGDLFRVALALSIAAFLGTFFLREVRLRNDDFYRQSQGQSESQGGGSEAEVAPQ